MVSNSIVYKTYQMLFIVYAPLALGGIILKMFGDVGSSYLQVVAISLCIASLIFAIGILFSFFHHRKNLMQTVEKSIPYILRHEFLAVHMVATILSFTAVAYFGLLGEGFLSKISGVAKRQRSTLTLLAELPQEGNQRPDGDISTLHGLTQWTARHISVNQTLQLDLIDHDDRFSAKLEAEVVQLINTGRQFFVCIGSPACVPLSENFDKIIAKSRPTSKPVLITTYAYGQVTTTPNMSYRFSPNSLDEVNALVMAALSDSNNKVASFITSDNEFGASAAEALMRQWRNPERSILPGIYVDSRADQQRVEDFVTGTGMRNNPPDVLFVATGTNINQVLLEIAKNTDTEFLFSSVYPARLIKELISEGVLASRVYQAELDFVSSYWPWEPQHNGEALLYLTLSKMHHVLSEVKENPDKFHDTWMDTTYPSGVKYSRASEADFSFPFLVRRDGKVVSLTSSDSTQNTNGKHQPSPQRSTE